MLEPLMPMMCGNEVTNRLDRRSRLPMVDLYSQHLNIKRSAWHTQLVGIYLRTVGDTFLYVVYALHCVVNGLCLGVDPMRHLLNFCSPHLKAVSGLSS